MAQTIKLKRSSTGGAVPSTSSLSLGEVAINTYDGKMYIKKNDGSDAIVEIGAGNGEAVWNSYDYTATSSQTSFSGSDNNSVTLSYVPGFLQVFLNGVLLDPAVDYAATTGNSVVLTIGATTSDLLQIETFTQIIGTGDILVDTFPVSSTQTAFTLSQDPINKNNISVYVEGVYQESSTYSLSGTTLTLSESPANGTTVEVVIGTRNVTLDGIVDLTISGTLHAGALDLGDANIINVNEISLDTIKGDADANTNITFAGSDVTTFTQGGQERLRLNTTGAQVTGNIVVSGTVDGRDVAADGVTADAALSRAGGAMGGAITTNSTFDGRDVSVDGTKLDGIESGATADQTDVEIRAAVESASDSNVFTNADHSKLDGIEALADVTDATNVTAAGALMDSEVTNLAQVKAFDSSDYATAAQGTTANAALPKAGGTMTGPLTVNVTGSDVDAVTITGTGVADFDFVANPPEFNLEDTSSTSGTKRARITVNDNQLQIAGLPDNDQAVSQYLFYGNLNNGNVGIGIDTPYAQLQVLDELKISTANQSSGKLVLGDGSSTNFNVGIARWNGTSNAAGAGGLGYFSQGTVNSGGHYFYNGDAVAGSTTEVMRINPDGMTEMSATKAYGSDLGLLRIRPSFTGTNYSAGAKINLVFGHETTANSYIGELRVTQSDPSVSTASTMGFYTNSGGGNSATTARMTISGAGNVGIGTTDPKAGFQVMGPASATVPAAGSGVVGGAIFSADLNTYGMHIGSITSGVGYIQQQRTNTATYYNLALQPNGGNVGIGTATPAVELHIHDEGGLSAIRLSGTASGADNFQIMQGVTGVNNAGFSIYDVDATTSRFVIDTSGKVGIGNTSPQHQLHFGSSGGYYASIGSGNTTPGGATPWLGVFNNASIASATFGWGVYDSSADGSLQICNRTNSTSGAVALTIKRGGNVGIGLDSPIDSKLVIVETPATIASGNAINGSTMKGLKLRTNANGDESVGVWFGTNGSHWSGISGQRKNAASTWGTDLRFYTHEDATADLTYTRERMRIDSSGKVGIGVTAPAHKLHVEGAIKTNPPVQTGNRQRDVQTWETAFSMLGTTATNWDMTKFNEGGAGNAFLVEVFWSHYASAAHALALIAIVHTRGTTIYQQTIYNHTHSYNGSFTISAPSATTLRINKLAGTSYQP